MAERVIGDVGAGFHIVDAGPVDLVALAPNLQFVLDGADGMDRVQMRQHQNSRAVAAPGRTRHQDVTETVAPGGAFDPGAQRRMSAFHMVDHAIDGVAVVRRAFDGDPLQDFRENFVGIQGRCIG